MNQVARLAVILLGGYLAATVFVSFAQTAVQQAALRLGVGGVWSAIGFFFATALVGIVFALLPAVFLVRRSQDIADRLYPDEIPQPSISHEGALVVGFTLLAIFFLFEGAIALVVGVSFLFSAVGSSDTLTEHAYPTLARAIASVGVGWFLYRYAVQRAASRSAT